MADRGTVVCHAPGGLVIRGGEDGRETPSIFHLKFGVNEGVDIGAMKAFVKRSPNLAHLVSLPIDENAGEAAG